MQTLPERIATLPVSRLSLGLSLVEDDTEYQYVSQVAKCSTGKFWLSNQKLGVEASPTPAITLLYRLPAQEGIGHVVNDIPDICRISCVGISDCDYIPCST
jgi:hypothetical protein